MAGGEEVWKVPDDETLKGKRITAAKHNSALAGLLRAMRLKRQGVDQPVVDRVNSAVMSELGLDEYEMREAREKILDRIDAEIIDRERNAADG